MDYCKTGNFGGLLGQSLALLFTSFTMTFTSTQGFLSKLGSKVGDIADKFSIWHKFYMYLTLIDVYLTLLPFSLRGINDENSAFDSSVLYNLFQYPLELIMMFVLGTFSKIAYSRISAEGTSIGITIVSACKLMYSVVTLMLSLVGFLIFYMRTHAYAVLL